MMACFRMPVALGGTIICLFVADKYDKYPAWGRVAKFYTMSVSLTPTIPKNNMTTTTTTPNPIRRLRVSR